MKEDYYMEHFGLLGLIPPILTIALALITKDVIISLFIGILSGTLIVAGGNPSIAIMQLTDRLADSLADGWNIRIFLFCGLLGALVGMLAKTGAAYSFGEWASKKIKTKRGGLLFTWVFGLIIFIDDYFNSLTIGTVMRPITDKTKTSRAKLAYILDSTAAPVCIIAPISSWVVYVMSVIKESDGFASLGIKEFNYFIHVIPFNLYALFTLLMVLVIIFTARDFGPMRKSAKRAEQENLLFNEEKYGAPAGNIEQETRKEHTHPLDMLLPIILLIVTALIFFPVSTWMAAVNGDDIKTFSQAVSAISLAAAYNDADASAALMYAVVVTLSISYIYYLARRLLTIKTAASAILDGLKSMVPALMILTMAWTIGAIIKSSPADGGLGLSAFLSAAVVNGGFPAWLLPVVAFVISCLISFSTGTSWGTFAIMIPIIMPISIALGNAAGLSGDALLHASLVSIGAVLGGAIFGDHASPISDTTILSSTGASCPHLEHVTTQVPYALFIAAAALAGHIAAGITLSATTGLLTSLAVFGIGFVVVQKFTQRTAA